jgi:hypothetical protein
MWHPFSDEMSSGQYIVQAVRAFLKRPDVPVDMDSEGFVVMHETGEVRRFPVPGDERNKSQLPLSNNGVDCVAHENREEGELGRWFIDIGQVWQRRLGGRSRTASVELMMLAHLGAALKAIVTEVSGENCETDSTVVPENAWPDLGEENLETAQRSHSI